MQPSTQKVVQFNGLEQLCYILRTLLLRLFAVKKTLFLVLKVARTMHNITTAACALISRFIPRVVDCAGARSPPNVPFDRSRPASGPWGTLERGRVSLVRKALFHYKHLPARVCGSRLPNECLCDESSMSLLYFRLWIDRILVSQFCTVESTRGPYRSKYLPR